MPDQTRATIDDFGAQWQRYRTNEGYYGSSLLFQDLLGPLLRAEEVAGARTADIGSGSGRIVLMLLRAGAAKVTAIEPSEAMAVLRENCREFGERVECIQARGESIPLDRGFDYVFSIGVLHHIPDPDPVVKAAFAALRPGGRMLIWIYGREGNEAYLRWALPLRRITCRLPDWMLTVLCRALDALLAGYIFLCRFLPLPMRAYMRGHLGKLSAHDRYVTVFDQLNPAEARYYREAEARALMERAGFQDVRLHHRHGYSWTMIGTRPGGV